MKTLTMLMMGAAMSIAMPAAAQDAAGDWSGTLDAGAAKLRIAVHIQHGEGDALTGTLDSPDQGAFGIPLAAIVLDGARLTFAVPAVSGHYTAEWDDATKGWRGSWSQGGAALPLALAPGGPPPEDRPPPPPLPANWEVPSNAETETLIAARNAPRAGQGIVVGVLEPGGQRIVAGGPAGAAEFNGDTLFEIGSISKVFTALILADMVAKGEVSLDDPAQKYLPEGATMPTRGGKQITLRNLSTHTSGLPRLPDNMPYGDSADPYADYTEAKLLQLLSGYELQRDIGGTPEYSNLGVGLLGYLLSRAAGTDYATLLRERITGPLGMGDTSIMLSADQQARFAHGHDAYMRPAKPWHLNVLVGAGGIRSTASDMLKFAAAILDPASPIAPATKIALAERVGTGSERSEQALGWAALHPEPGRELLMHDGGTGGYRSLLVIEPAKERAVVALTNSAAEPAVSDLALYLIAGSPIAPTPPVPPAPPPVVERTAIELPPAELDRVVGRYDFGSGIVFDVVRDGTGLKAQRQGSVTGPALPIFPEAPLAFFWKAVDAQVRFIADASGKVTAAEFSQGGQTLPGKRIEP